MRRFALGIFTLSIIFTTTAQADEKSAIAEIQKLGGAVRKVAASVEWQEVDFHLAGTDVTDDGLVHLKEVQQLVAVHLKNTKITDAGLKHLAGLTELKRLHLELTGIDGSGLAHIKGLDKLEYLNVYGTKVNDTALAHLHGLKSLKKLYVWQTTVTDEGIAALQKALPDLKIDRGLIQKPAEGEAPKEPAK
ncbi:MAG: hypothetical protein ACI9G1_006124 [Pirellulaceae bacterium]|jgi:hypothetical protein